MKSATSLQKLMGRLSEEARNRGLSAASWASRARVRPETLSRLRTKESCDLATLEALAGAVGATVGLEFAKPAATADGHFPLAIDREYEERLADLCASRTLADERWRALGPDFFMAGLAVLSASMRGFDRRGLLELAERLHPGASEPAVFERWLARGGLEPSRFLPMVDRRVGQTA